MQWAGPLPAHVRHIGFSTGWGSVGEFRIWRKEDADENHNEAFTLGVPHNVVPGSERATAAMIGEEEFLVYPTNRTHQNFTLKFVRWHV